jgi:protein-disulfide isomerase
MRRCCPSGQGAKLNKNTLFLFGILAVVIISISGVTFMSARVGRHLVNAISDQQREINGLAQQVSQLREMLAKLPVNEINNQQIKINGISQQLSKLTDLIAKGPGGGKAAAEDFTKVYNIPIGKSPVLGAPEASVTITAFLDLECPFSARFQPVIDQVLAAYPGQIKYMVKHFPLSFHQRAKPAAKFLLAAGKQGKYWEMLAIILKDNKDLSDAKLDEMAKSLKLNLNLIKSDLKTNDAQWEKLIQEDFALGASVDVAGTPMYYINGRKTKARDLAAFKTEIDAILNTKSGS